MLEKLYETFAILTDWVNEDMITEEQANTMAVEMLQDLQEKTYQLI